MRGDLNLLYVLPTHAHSHSPFPATPVMDAGMIRSASSPSHNGSAGEAPLHSLTRGRPGPAAIPILESSIHSGTLSFTPWTDSALITALGWERTRSVKLVLWLLGAPRALPHSTRDTPPGVVQVLLPLLSLYFNQGPYTTESSLTSAVALA